MDALPNDVDNVGAQRAALLAFAKAIGARARLGRDKAGNPRLEGRAGRIYVQPRSAARDKPIYQIYCSTAAAAKEHEGGARPVHEAGERRRRGLHVRPRRPAPSGLRRDHPRSAHDRQASRGRGPSPAQLAARAAFAADRRRGSVQADQGGDQASLAPTLPKFCEAASLDCGEALETTGSEENSDD